jgi:hypothetical protein
MMTEQHLSLLIAGLGTATALITLGVVVFQIYLMVRQTTIMSDQLRIMRKQDEIMAAQMARQPVPQFRLELTKGGQHGTLHFWIRNDGTKAVRDFHWYLIIPPGTMNTGPYLTGIQAPIGAENEPVDGQLWLCYHRYETTAIYPTREEKIGSAGLNLLHDPFPCHWRIVSEDGVFQGVVHL